ncbi:MAG: sulfatase-like hydrolase/transferase [Caldilineaceae bacterium]
MQQHPNILWVSFEDCYPYFGCYGDPAASTPNLDALAAEVACGPTPFPRRRSADRRSAVITGMYPVSIGTHHHRTGTGANYDFPHNYEAVVPHYVKCFPEYLRAAGYYCTNNFKTDYQFAPPITAWDDCSPHGHWRHRPDPQQPFFAVWNLTQTHESGMWEDKWPDINFDLDKIEVPPYFPDTPKVRQSMARMYANIEANDRRLGEILAELEQDGLAENTVVFIWTDHGPMPRGKRWPYDSGIHSPLIVRWPGVLEAGTVSDHWSARWIWGKRCYPFVGWSCPITCRGSPSWAQRPRRCVNTSSPPATATTKCTTPRAPRDHRFKYMRHYHRRRTCATTATATSTPLCRSCGGCTRRRIDRSASATHARPAPR